MAAKGILLLCAQALLAHLAFSQCTSRATIGASKYGAPNSWSNPGLACDGLAAPARAYDSSNWVNRAPAREGIYPAIDFTSTSGGGLPVTSTSAIAPTGISIVSENAIEGALSVAGELPFVSSTAVDGVMPAAGAGGVNHSCGNGVTAIASETTTFAPAAISNGAAIAPAAAISSSNANSPGASFASNLGLGLGNRFGFRGCGNHGVVY